MFTAYLMAIVMFAVAGLIAVSLITTINHFDGSDAEKPRRLNRRALQSSQVAA